MTSELNSLTEDLVADTAVEKMIAESCHLRQELKKHGDELVQEQKKQEMEASIKKS